ncbi:uncharacterized protein B0T23DRAFT_368495 [Neurospora hispaniola]|uniref:Uncharacterized protein n=1 Tax=Neurospora hispaniola TaxID=588809 RepID=A0AAJ0IE99_9PEZI|nr:hypothetical protein B0T23DRAFT_368495 [Neurospora hispaniola]
MIKATFYVLKEEAPAEKEAAKIDGKRELLLKTARKKHSNPLTRKEHRRRLMKQPSPKVVRPNVARLGRQVLGMLASPRWTRFPSSMARPQRRV